MRAGLEARTVSISPVSESSPALVWVREHLKLVLGESGPRFHSWPTVELASCVRGSFSVHVDDFQCARMEGALRRRDCVSRCAPAGVSRALHVVDTAADAILSARIHPPRKVRAELILAGVGD